MTFNGGDESNNEDPIPDLDEKNSEDRTSKTPLAAGIAAGVVSAFLLGPTLGLMAGFGVAYAAATSRSAVGDASRAVGEAALDVQAHAVDVNERYKVVEKTKVAANQAWEATKQANERHRFLERAGETVSAAASAAYELDRRHRVVETTAMGISWLFAKLAHSVAKIHDSAEAREMERSSTREVVGEEVLVEREMHVIRSSARPSAPPLD